MSTDPEWVSLNVGGTRFMTTRSTLCLDPNSLLATLFPTGPAKPTTPAGADAAPLIPTDATGAYLLDRDPTYFAPVLSFLRSGHIFVDDTIAAEGVLHEARAFRIAPLVARLEALLADAAAPPPLDPQLYLVVRSVTLYHAGRARIDISYMGPLSRRKREALHGLDLVPALNILASWGWRLIASCGKGGDHEKHILYSAASERTVDRYVGTIVSPSVRADPMAALGAEFDPPLESETDAAADAADAFASSNDPDSSSSDTESSYESSSSSASFAVAGPSVATDAEVADAARSDTATQLPLDDESSVARLRERGDVAAEAALSKAVKRARRKRRKRDSIAVVRPLHELIRRDDEWVSLNVGGKVFTTTLRTLRAEDRAPNSMLAQMFRPVAAPAPEPAPEPEPESSPKPRFAWTSAKDPDGNYLLDRDPRYFGPILHFLRTGALVINPGVSLQGVREEAMFFQIEPLIELVNARINEKAPVPIYQYLVVRSVTLYYAQKAQVKITIRGPYHRFADKELANLSLAQVFNVIASDGWRLVAASGRGGDHEKFCWERPFVDTHTARPRSSSAAIAAAVGPTPTAAAAAAAALAAAATTGLPADRRHAHPIAAPEHPHVVADLMATTDDDDDHDGMLDA